MSGRVAPGRLSEDRRAQTHTTHEAASVSAPLPKGIMVGQTWTGRSGMGPTVRIKDIDLETGLVHTEYVPTDTRHPTHDVSIDQLIKCYKLQS